MKMIHSCLRVLDLEASLRFYRLVFGFQEHARHVFDSFTLCYLRLPASDFELELTVNHGRTEAYNVGDGYGHLALLVDDLPAALARYQAWAGDAAASVEVKRLEHEGELLGEFFFAADPDGYKIEVLSKSGRFAAQA